VIIERVTNSKDSKVRIAKIPQKIRNNPKLENFTPKSSNYTILMVYTKYVW
jgi:hypothetical protein